MKTRFNYHCIECNSLILASNTPQDVSTSCMDCDFKHISQMMKRKKEPIRIDEEGKHKMLYKNIKKKRYKKCYN